MNPNPYGFGNLVPGSQLMGMLPWQRKQKAERLAELRWSREVYGELRMGQLDYGSADWQHEQWCAAGEDVRARWQLGEADLR